MPPLYKSFRRTVVTLAVLWIGFTIHGIEKVPATGPLIVAANHRRLIDPILVSMAVPRWVKWMAKKELFSSRWFARLLVFLGAFPIDRQRSDRAALRKALSLLSSGETLGIFPEGTRQKAGVKAIPKSGVGMLTIRSGAPVLPVYVGPIPGFFERLSGKRLEAYIGKPLYFDKTRGGSGAYREIAGEVLEAIYALEPKVSGKK